MIKALVAIARGRRPRLRVALHWYLAAIIGLLMTLSLGLTLWLSLGTAASNTRSLLSDKASLVVDLVVQRTRDYLRSAEMLAGEIAGRIERDELDVADDAELVSALRYAFAAASQLTSTTYIDMKGWQLTVFRTGDTPSGTGWEKSNWHEDPVFRRAGAQTALDGPAEPAWLDPLYVPDAGTTLIIFMYPVRRADRMTGIIATSLRVETLSTFLMELGASVGQGAFILFGRDKVLANYRLSKDISFLDEATPLPDLASIGDPILASIWAKGWQERPIEMAGAGHWAQVNGESIYYLYDEVSERRPTPWIVGAYFTGTSVGREVERLKWASIVAVLFVLLSLGAVFWLAHRLAEPPARLAHLARRISRLDLDNVTPMPRSHVRETDDAAQAFNGMIAALKHFVRYVPRDLVVRLMANPDEAAAEPQSRDMTIMFTDLSNFTGLAEQQSPADTAHLLEAHFGMVADCIAERDGTVDKFLGDGTLAFWNAPGRVENHAECAVEAAMDIARRHLESQGLGGRQIGLRIAVHTGTVIVGNIGTASRLNYTVIGDAVNTTQRLQDMARTLLPDALVAVVVSADCFERLQHDHGLKPLGAHVPRGRQRSVELYGCSMS